MNEYFLYILSNVSNKTLYIGITNNLSQRIYQHKNKLIDHSFTKRYNINKLVYYEAYNDIHLAIEREKQIKKWNKAWKIRLIEKLNPNWLDLYELVLEIPDKGTQE